MNNTIKEIDNDEIEAFDMLHDAAESGNEFAQLYLGFCYHLGAGVVASVDPCKDGTEKAEKWLWKAYKQGNVKAGKYLAEIYMLRGDEKNLKRLLKKAKEDYLNVWDKLKWYYNDRDTIDAMNKDTQQDKDDDE